VPARPFEPNFAQSFQGRPGVANLVLALLAGMDPVHDTINGIIAEVRAEQFDQWVEFVGTETALCE
jgi:hypothetical protein